MELLFEQPVTVSERDVNEYGQMKLSSLLYFAQETSGGHCNRLGFGWDQMAEKGLFWAVLRHRVLIHRLPGSGEKLTVQTWPLPATRTAYPRMVRGLDADGKVLFEVLSLWTMMNVESRAMVLPVKSGIDVPGILRGCEIDPPSSLPPVHHEKSLMWTVEQVDLDINGHVNNAKYLDHAESLTGSFRADHTPKEVTVCYLSECRLGQSVSLNWTLSGEGVFALDGCRQRADAPEKTERVFSVKIQY